MSLRPAVVVLAVAACLPARADWLGLTHAASTYLGGSLEDEILAVAVDAGGAAYVAGRTVSSDLPTTAAAYRRTKPGGWNDASGFVGKVAPDGSLAWLTYLGGSLGDEVHGIAVDARGRVLVTGWTTSGDFPTTPDSFRPTCGSGVGGSPCSVGFLAVLSPDGATLEWSSFVAGDAVVGTTPRALVLSQGLACLAGSTVDPTFPVTADAPQRTLAGTSDAFVACFDVARSGRAALAFSTFFGGSGSDEAFAIAADGSGRLFAAGWTDSRDLPVVSAAQPTYGGGATDAFVLGLSPGRAVAYATYLGGSNIDSAHGMAASTDGHTYVTGQTKSSDLPTVSALQFVIGGDVDGETFGDAFVAGYDPGGALAFSTFLGGYTWDWGRAVAIGGDGVVHVCGATWSPDFPTLSGAPDLSPHNQVAFATGFLPDGSRPVYSTLYGALADPFACAAAGDQVVLAGEARAGGVPVATPVRPYGGGAADGFVARLTTGAPGTADVAVKGSLAAGRGGVLEGAVVLTNHGPDAATGLVFRLYNWPGVTVAAEGCMPSMLGIFTLCQAADLPAGASRAVPITIAPAYPGTLEMLLSVASHQADPEVVNDLDVLRAGIPEAHLAAAVAVSPGAGAQGEEVVAAIDVFNQGPDAAGGVRVAVSPAGGRPGAAGLPSGCSPGAGRLLLCDLGALGAGASAHLDLPIQLVMGGGAMPVEVEATSMSLQAAQDGRARTELAVAYADAALVAPRPAATVDAGQSASFDLELRRLAGRYPAGWTLSCSGPGSGIGCEVTASTLDPGAAVARGGLTVSTTGRTTTTGTAGRTGRPGGPAGLVGALAALLALLAARGRSLAAMPRLAAALLAAVAATACGGRGDAGGARETGDTPAGTYVVRVTATLGEVPEGFAYGTITRSTEVTVTVR